MQILQPVTVLFTAALAISLLIERLIEILKAGYDLMDSRLDWYHQWSRLAARTAERLEGQLRVYEFVKPEAAAGVLRRFSEEMSVTPGPEAANVPVVSGDLVRISVVKVASKFLGSAIGIAIAFGLQLDLVRLWAKAFDQANSTGPGVAHALAFPPIAPLVPGWLTTLFTGVVLGLGSGPIHKLITAIEDSNAARKAARSAQ